MTARSSALALLLAAPLAAQFDAPDYPFPVPAGLEAPEAPADNPVTRAKVDLGRALYFDPRLSKDGTVSCASCHDPKKGWTDQAPVSTGIRGQKGGRSAPSVLNAAYYDLQFWDGRAPSLEEQAKGPIQNPIEMGFTHDGAVKRLKGIKGYRPLFDAAFGKGSAITIDAVARAIASFERTALSGGSKYDLKAMDEPAQRGMGIFFGKARCSECHTGFNFSDSDFHNLGVGMSAKEPDLGRFAKTGKDSDRGAFKTPTLRGLSRTAPYMHDGSQRTLAEVVDFYDKGGEKNPWLSSKVQALKLTKGEKKDLLAFLEALDGAPVEIAPPALPK